MRLGLTLTPTARGLRHTLDLAAAAERAGFESIYLTERHFAAIGGFANPFAVASAVASRLQHAWLGVRPALGLEHPLRVVEQSNLLDVLTGGRSVVVLGDELDPNQYSAFGLSTPRDGLVDRMLDAWSFHFDEDAPPLEFSSGPFSARMAGRLMPAPCRTPHPLLARETDSPQVVIDAARRGWSVQLRGPRPRTLAEAYRNELIRHAHPNSTLDECLRWLVVVLPVASVDVQPVLNGWEELGVAEVRLDPLPGVQLDQLINQVA